MDVGLRGRDAELQRLARIVEEAVAGSGRVVLICGEPGIGKSRLATAMVAQARQVGLRVLSGRTTDDDGAPPHWPWLQVLRPLGAEDLLLAPAGADPEAERFARQVAVTRAVLDAPTLVLVEDVHRADAASMRLLVHLAAEVADRGCVLVVTVRPSPADHAAGFGQALEALTRVAGAERMELAGLDLDAVQDLLLPTGCSQHATRVWQVSDGNPLLVGELCRHLAAGGSPDSVPRSVRDSVQGRLLARSATCVEAVRRGALLGREFPGSVVAQALEQPPSAILADLDEAVDAGLLDPSRPPGTYRFPHALIRDAVADSLSASERAMAHRDLALALEALDGAGDHNAAELARHWDAASAAGDQERAARWCERAAVVADKRLGWDEASRLFDRALELGGYGDPEAVCRRALGSARARLHCDELDAAVELCLLAARTALDTGLPELLAEAVLVPEARGVTSRELFDFGEAALAALGPSPHALRARLHGQLVNLALTLVEPTMLRHADAAQAEAALTDDPLAQLAAIRARHMVGYGVEHAELRLTLAGQLGEVARQARMPSAAAWEPLWAIDALVELGRLPEALALLSPLRAAVAAAGTPILRWHLERTRTHLAQSTGRFSDAVHHATAARDLYAQLENPFAADVIYVSQLLWIGMHAGEIPGAAEKMAAVPIDRAPIALGDMPALGAAEASLRLGNIEAALAFYRRVAPARGWSVPLHLGLYPWALRLRVAVALQQRDEVSVLLEEARGFRGRHVGSTGSRISYLGTMELWTGIANGFLERWDEADDDLATASTVARTIGAPGFAVHADVERAEVLKARGRAGDAVEAGRLLTAARPVAADLGMHPFLTRIDEQLGAHSVASPPVVGPLSLREAQVAALIADGLTNREIARTLTISERTAQNHVQHILTKLGLTNRRDVASWYRTSIAGEPAATR